MVIAFQAVVAFCVLVGVAFLVGATRPGRRAGPVGGVGQDGPGGVDGSRDGRLRLGLAVPSNGQACGPD